MDGVDVLNRWMGWMDEMYGLDGWMRWMDEMVGCTGRPRQDTQTPRTPRTGQARTRPGHPGTETLPICGKIGRIPGHRAGTSEIRTPSVNAVGEKST